MFHQEAKIVIIIVCFITTITQVVVAFHLSFGHRLPLKSVNSPQLNPDSHLIRPVECRNANNHSEAGICMFSIDCMQNKGTPLSICKHKYFVGTCCRLPDYNNFVGIVYDLRDTETNHVLEAREVSPATQNVSSSGFASTLTPSSSSSSKQPVAADSTASEDVRSTRIITEAHRTTSASFATTTTTKDSGADLVDSRYRISSTSLFGPTTTTTATAATTPSSKTGESARNSEGSAEPIKLIELANLESQLHLISNNRNNSQQEPSKMASSGLFAETQQQQQQKHAYEIVKDLDSEVLSTFNSVHSPPSIVLSGKPAASSQQLKQSIIYGSTAPPPPPPTQQSAVQPEMSSPNELSAATIKPTELQTTQVGEVVSASRGPNPAASTATSDQEFTLSTSADSSPSSSLAPASSSYDRPIESLKTTPQPYFVRVESLSASSISDLVSATGSQTTTPFTVSLSTARLPNISSHSYAPTQQPTSALVSQQSSTKFPPSPSPSSPASPAPTSAAAGTSQSYELANFSQLYSNQHSSSAEPIVHSAPSRPSLHSTLQAASKIVTGSSSTNNLIPGLSNLQSAILSHIPFKIASGLSNYLQAAMKPTGNKPLISSNTAPHLQYQQQQHQHSTVNSNRSQPTTSTTTTTTTTTTTVPTVMMAPSGVRFPGDNELQQASGDISTVSFPVPQQIVGLTSSYDVVRESQRVCGRPQVQQQQTTPLAEGVNKRMARIVGGNQSSFGQWPWMVSLRQWRKGAFLHKCGAALLNENWAITAAHCVEDVKVTDLLLRLGEFDVSNQEEPDPFIERRVKTVKSHPLFNPKTFEYDLALLKFAEPIKYERNIIPVCVPSGNDTYIDRMATVIGWGRLYEDGPLPDVIQHVDVPIITNNECEKMYKNAGYIEEIPDMFICAGINKGGRDSCEGDSGGPLTMVDHDGRSYLVGIISWGIGCALPSQPGVYTRITAFSGWINELAGS